MEAPNAILVSVLRKNSQDQMAMVVAGGTYAALARWRRPPILPSGLERFREAQIRKLYFHYL